MDQRRKVVFLQSRLSEDENRSLLYIRGGLAHGIPELLGVTTAANDTPTDIANEKRSKAQQYSGCSQCHSDTNVFSLNETSKAAFL